VWEDLAWEDFDILSAVLELRSNSFHRCEASTEFPGHENWVFCPEDDDGDGSLWIRLTIRRNLIVISFHRG